MKRNVQVLNNIIYLIIKSAVTLWCEEMGRFNYTLKTVSWLSTALTHGQGASSSNNCDHRLSSCTCLSQPWHSLRKVPFGLEPLVIISQQIHVEFKSKPHTFVYFHATSHISPTITPIHSYSHSCRFRLSLLSLHFGIFAIIFPQDTTVLLWYAAQRHKKRKCCK